MVFGDGDGVIFFNFANSLDVIGHELTRRDYRSSQVRIGV